MCWGPAQAWTTRQGDSEGLQPLLSAGLSISWPGGGAPAEMPGKNFLGAWFLLGPSVRTAHRCVSRKQEQGLGSERREVVSEVWFPSWENGITISATGTLGTVPAAQ